MSAIADLHAAVRDAASAVAAGAPDAPVDKATLDRPKQAEHGDFATNAAMVLTKALRRPPREIADELAERLRLDLGVALERVEVAGPGFLNLVLSDAWHAGALAGVLTAGEAFGGGGAQTSRRVCVEFVSANPTGPLHVGHTRNAAYGDALARILAFHGHEVSREYYVNDFGSQVARLGESVRARARGEQPAEDGYRGEYVVGLAEQIEDADGDDLDRITAEAVALMRESARQSLERFRVEFDVWFSERTLHEVDPGRYSGRSAVEHAFDVLAEQGRTYEHEGALWLRTTEFGDDKDRVLRRSTGDHTYFASDIAYHQEKRERGFELLIDVWGADHHGYVGRMQMAWRALGGAPEDFEPLIMQFVRLKDGEDLTSMSKRAGNIVTLDDLVDEIGVDAARWFLLARSHDTTMDLDLAAARDQSRENPVYYVQYAHARIASVLREVGEDRVARALAHIGGGLVIGESLHPSERDLLKMVLGFGDAVEEAAERRAPHRITTYALELAQLFSAFYRDCRVKDVEPEGLRTYRLALCIATQRTLARSLDLLGVDAPLQM